MTFNSHRRLEFRFLGDRVEDPAVFLLHVLNVAEPVVDEANRPVLLGRDHTAAPVMPADDDVPDLERHLHGILNHGEAIEIRVADDVGDVAVDEQFPGIMPTISLAGTRLSAQPIHGTPAPAARRGP